MAQFGMAPSPDLLRLLMPAYSAQVNANPQPQSTYTYTLPPVQTYDEAVNQIFIEEPGQIPVAAAANPTSQASEVSIVGEYTLNFPADNLNDFQENKDVIDQNKLKRSCEKVVERYKEVDALKKSVVVIDEPEPPRKKKSNLSSSAGKDMPILADEFTNAPAPTPVVAGTDSVHREPKDLKGRKKGSAPSKIQTPAPSTIRPNSEISSQQRVSKVKEKDMFSSDNVPVLVGSSKTIPSNLPAIEYVISEKNGSIPSEKAASKASGNLAPKSDMVVHQPSGKKIDKVSSNVNEKPKPIFSSKKLAPKLPVETAPGLTDKPFQKPSHQAAVPTNSKHLAHGVNTVETKAVTGIPKSTETVARPDQTSQLRPGKTTTSRNESKIQQAPCTPNPSYNSIAGRKSPPKSSRELELGEVVISDDDESSNASVFDRARPSLNPSVSGGLGLSTVQVEPATVVINAVGLEYRNK